MNTKNKKVFLKKYTNSELKTFANLSKDFNEIHFDNEFTNRSVYGKKIVYGVLILLDVLDKLNYNSLKFKINNLSCDFISPIFTNEKIFFLANYNNKKINIKIFKNKNEIYHFVRKNIDNNHHFMFKGSNSTGLQEVVSNIKKRKIYAL